MAAALRQRYGKDKLTVVMSRPIGSPRSVTRTSSGRSASVRHSFPSDYRRALEALNKGRPVAMENHNELSGS